MKPSSVPEDEAELDVEPDDELLEDEFEPKLAQTSGTLQRAQLATLQLTQDPSVKLIVLPEVQTHSFPLRVYPLEQLEQMFGEVQKLQLLIEHKTQDRPERV